MEKTHKAWLMAWVLSSFLTRRLTLSSNLVCQQRLSTVFIFLDPFLTYSRWEDVLDLSFSLLEVEDPTFTSEMVISSSFSYQEFSPVEGLTLTLTHNSDLTHCVPPGRYIMYYNGQKFKESHTGWYGAQYKKVPRGCDQGHGHNYHRRCPTD